MSMRNRNTSRSRANASRRARNEQQDQEVERIRAASARQRAYHELTAEWERRKAGFVDAAWLSMLRDQSMSAWYAYIKPSGPSTWGVLLPIQDGTDAPEGFELVTAERIPSGTKQQVRQWFEKFAGRLPVFPQE